MCRHIRFSCPLLWSIYSTMCVRNSACMCFVDKIGAFGWCLLEIYWALSLLWNICLCVSIQFSYVRERSSRCESVSIPHDSTDRLPKGDRTIRLTYAIEHAAIEFVVLSMNSTDHETCSCVCRGIAVISTVPLPYNLRIIIHRQTTDAYDMVNQLKIN